MVSVVIPSYNAGRFLPELCRSLQAQTFGDFEVLIGDDGSTDDTPAAVRPFLTDARFTYIRWEQNRGVNAATVDLLERVRGEFWAHPGADDALGPEFLARRVEVMRDHSGAGLVHGMPRFVDEAGGELPEHKVGMAAWVLRRPAMEELAADDACPVVLQHNIINTPSVLVRMALTRRVLDLMRTRWRYAQDWSFWILHAAMGGCLVWDARVLSDYRVVKTSLTCNPRHAAVRRAETRLIPLCTLAAVAPHSELAARIWSRWSGPLYHLWLRRAWALRASRTLDPQWLALAAAAYWGVPAPRPCSLLAETLRKLWPVWRDAVREERARKRQAFAVSGLASIDHPFFREQARLSSSSR